MSDQQFGIFEQFNLYKMYKMTKKTRSGILTKKTRSAKCHTKRRFVTHTFHLIITYVRTIPKAVVS